MPPAPEKQQPSAIRPWDILLFSEHKEDVRHNGSVTMAASLWQRRGLAHWHQFGSNAVLTRFQRPLMSLPHLEPNSTFLSLTPHYGHLHLQCPC